MKSKTRYGILFLMLLTVASLCKGVITKYNNDKNNIEPVYKIENQH